MSPDYIGHNHFLDQIEPLPGETIVWEGGASLVGILVQFLRVTGIVVLIVGTLSIVFFLPDYLYELNESEISVDDSVSTPAVKEPENVISKRDEPELVLIKQRLYTLYGLMLPAILILIFLSSWFRVRHYWMVVTSERICIQSGTFTRQVATLDIDKVVSVISSHTILDRIFKLHTVEIVHPGTHAMQPNNALVSLFNPYRINYVPVSTNLVGRLLNEWLPRDNRTN